MSTVFSKSLLIIVLFFIGYANVSANSMCEDYNNTANNFVKLVSEQERKVDNNTITETDKASLLKEFQRIEAFYTDPGMNPAHVSFNRFLLIKCTTSYYNYLFRLKDFQQIVDLGKKTFTYTDKLKAEDCTCEIKGYKTVQSKKNDPEFGEYTVSKQIVATVGTLKITPQSLYDMSDALLSVVTLAAHRVKNYELRDQFFTKTFQKGFIDWGGNVTPYTTSSAILKTYVEGQPIKDVELFAAVAYFNVIPLRTPEQLNTYRKTDSATHAVAKNIIIKTFGDKVNPITNTDTITYAKALIAFLHQKSISAAEKADFVATSIRFLRKATVSFNENWSFELARIFEAFEPEVTALILHNPDATVGNNFIDYIGTYQVTALRANGQMYYDTYLYCKQKKDKRAKAIYKYIEYAKQLYPTYVK